MKAIRFSDLRLHIFEVYIYLKQIEQLLLDIEQLQGKINELLHENKLLQTQYDERKIHIQYVSLHHFLLNINYLDILNQNYINPIRI